MKNIKQESKAGIDELAEKIKSGSKEDYQDIIDNVLKKSMKMKDMLGMTDATVEGIYGQAYRLYNNGKYREAINLFRLLIMLNSTESKYLMGLAACFHMMKEYKTAIETYTLCGVIDKDNPLPHFHASDCYIQKKDNVGALLALKMAIKRSKDKPEFKVLHDRCVITYEGLKKQLIQENKKGG